MRPPLLGLRHVALFAPDLAASERFWVDVMGYAVEWRPDPDNVYLTSGADNLALHARASTAAGGDGEPDSRLDHIGLAVRDPGDVDAWARHLRACGVSLAAEPKQHRDGSRSLYFNDPAGISVQIIHHGPISTKQAGIK